MADLPIPSDLRHLEQSALQRGSSRLVSFLGDIVAAGSILAIGDYQVSALSCRRRPSHRPCPGKIRLGRDPENDAIRWSCTVCRDGGAITNWQWTQWDRGSELKQGQVVSLAAERARRAAVAARPAAGPRHLLELRVELVRAPLFLEGSVSRRLRLEEGSSLQELHAAIHQAFDREEEGPFEFHFGALYEADCRQFRGPTDLDQETQSPGQTASVRLTSLELKPGTIFGYLFDYFEEWVHRVTVISRREVSGPPARPRVIQRQGASPPLLPPAEATDDSPWSGLDTIYPLSSLYGPYRVDEGPAPETWLALDDLERQLLIIELHAQGLPAWHAAVAEVFLHAVIHDLAEVHLAGLGRRKARALLRKHPLGEGDRHRVIHAIGEELVRVRLDAGTPPAAPPRLATPRPRRR